MYDQNPFFKILFAIQSLYEDKIYYGNMIFSLIIIGFVRCGLFWPNVAYTTTLSLVLKFEQLKPTDYRPFDWYASEYTNRWLSIIDSTVYTLLFTLIDV